MKPLHLPPSPKELRGPVQRCLGGSFSEARSGMLDMLLVFETRMLRKASDDAGDVAMTAGIRLVRDI